MVPIKRLSRAASRGALRSDWEIIIDQSGEISLRHGCLPTDANRHVLPLLQRSFSDKKTLTIFIGEKRHVYDLGDKTFKVSIPRR